MKLALISYANLKGDKHWNLILETAEDVQIYFDASSKLGIQQFIDIWTELKGGQTWPHYFNERIHQASVKGALTMVSMKAEQAGECSLVDACEINDKLLFNKLRSMRKMIENGEQIRVSSKGGYSGFDEMYQTHEEMECTEKQMREYLLAKDGMKFDLAISRNIIIIENESMVSDVLDRKIRNELKIHYSDYEPVLNFKYRTDNWTAAEFYKLFDDAVKNGLHTIIVETSINDKQQFESMAELLKKVMGNNPNKSLEVKILTSSGLLQNYVKDLPQNLTLTLL